MTPTSFHRLAARILLVTFTTCSLGAGSSFGQAPPSPAPYVSPNATLPTPPTLPAEPPQQLTKDELRELVAPVALYPDVVLASLLPATTNPDQLHDAAQFVGTAARVETIPEDRGWDGSIIGLLQFPDVLRWLDENPAWTDQMGQAVTYQQGDVLQAIQDFRRAAKNAGNLESNQYQKVRAEPDRDIYIEPARPDVVYVPSYDPVLATQPQPVVVSPGINPWIAFGGGVAVGALGAWALYSIFDDDDHYHRNYYGGGRRICGYDNYYYYGRRRPRQYDWNPRPRPYRSRPQGWQRPRRLQYAAPATRPARGGALRPPRKPPETRELRPREQRQENRRQRQVQRQENRQGRQLQRRDQRQERQERRQENKQQKQQGRQEKRQGRQQQRREQQGQRQERRQEQKTQRQENRQTQRGERQEKRQNQQVQRQERRTERRSERQGEQKKQSGNNKKKQQQQQ
jgi:Protein of unknown function (DUF3300)